MDDLYNPKEPLILRLRLVIHFLVRCLAVLMTLVILWGVVDVGWVIYQKLRTPPLMMMNISDMLATFGAFMAVLIAIEIFINITIYLRDDVIHVKIVLATALMAIARKVIIMDVETTTTEYMWATAAVVLAMSIGYYLVVKDSSSTRVAGGPQDPSRVHLRHHVAADDSRDTVQKGEPPVGNA
ncbi:phosphate-starvation-inducible PsiE family protein [Desulfobulbus alkaliphilus]|uniref:phosphate-starvation-inducible PsiE family protein n=1 Tax=Desulfobulbus alkaliphilus TaxID=869814 RepID=UPI0019631B01|nr:phosphate-starvation-inducible PsiE family protein [Desulfobulbus alkaliphilus]MBM9536552.1 phosphate-starvation-inducible PsiE family protein [Desulfobulbus alkaliphilus]